MLKLSKKRHKNIYRFLASKELALGLFASISFFLAVTTFIDQRDSIIWDIIRVLFCLMVINLSMCTIQKIKSLPKPVLIMHLGVIITVIGGGISSYGFVATVNIYEGTSVDKVFRWDIMKEVSLGVDIMVERLHEQYYPVPVKVGVLKGKDKTGLFTLKTGESFELENYRVLVNSLDQFNNNLRLTVYNQEDYVGSVDTSGVSVLPPAFPYEFKLVAYMDPVIKSSRVDIKLINGSDVLAEGITAVNSPLLWEGLNFYHTVTDRDMYGNTFVGMQITRDPGILYVYTGFCIFVLGGTYYLLRKIHRSV